MKGSEVNRKAQQLRRLAQAVVAARYVLIIGAAALVPIVVLNKLFGFALSPSLQLFVTAILPMLYVSVVLLAIVNWRMNMGYIKCPACGNIYADPRPTTDKRQGFIPATCVSCGFKLNSSSERPVS